jgi:dihydropyrimidine dehydrogenase (NAD+) subunit PreT
MMPKKLHITDGAVTAITLEKTALDDSGKLDRHRRNDHARGRSGVQGHRPDPGCGSAGGRGDHPRKGRIRADENRRTSHPKIWAGGDCIAGGEDLTVVSVEDGKIAAQSIHQALMG